VGPDYLHVGFAQVVGDPRNNKFYNFVVVIDPKGKNVGKYHKINLFELENEFLQPGKEIFTYDSPWGKIGVIVCADVYSGFPMDDYKSAGVDVLALSTSWAQMNTGMNSFTAGAERVGAYLLAANQNYFPDSGVINPDGSKQSHIRQSDGVAYGYLPRK
jgi:predicted amidohydrolase